MPVFLWICLDCLLLCVHTVPSPVASQAQLESPGVPVIQIIYTSNKADAGGGRGLRVTLTGKQDASAGRQIFLLAKLNMWSH